MIRKLLFLILLLPLCVKAQVVIKGSISGYGKNQVIDYFQPIGRYATTNRNLVTYKIKDDSTFYLKLAISQPIFITIKIAGERSYLLVKPGDVITMDLKRTEDPSKYLKISGSNAPANSWYNSYTYNPYDVYAKHDSLINLLKTKGAKNAFNSIKNFITGQYAPIDSLFNRGEIDETSFSLFKKEVTVSHASIFILKISQLKSNDNIILNNIAELKDSIYKKYPPLDPDNIRLTMGEGYLLFSEVRDFVKTPANTTLADSVFGVYNQYLLLPPLFAEGMLGTAVLSQKVLASDEFNFEKGYAVFKRKFPASKYIDLIDAYVKEENLLAKSNYADITIDTVSNFKTIQDIVNRYKGQNIYIDLWATWCAPCKQEFPYYKDLENDFKLRNIKLISVSIDKPAMKNYWEKVILTSHLKGTHFLVNKDLMEDINDKVYNYKQVSIPRYLLFDKNGKLVNGDAPRPSARGDLVTLFKEKL
ncbi:TlpA family protein disulfide reductase [Mucilaginibacter phyllosphaerae]